MYFCSLFYHQLAHDIREFSDQKVLVSLSTKWGECISPNSFSERFQSSWGGKNCWGLKNIALFVAITHYYLFNQSLSDFAQVDVANHLNSGNEHSMSYDGVPQDCFKPWNPWGDSLDLHFLCCFYWSPGSREGPPPRPRNSDRYRRVWESKPRGLSLCPKVGLHLVKC